MFVTICSGETAERPGEVGYEEVDPSDVSGDPEADYLGTRCQVNIPLSK